MTNIKKRLLVFHPFAAPYRLDLFNRLCTDFHTQVCLFSRNPSSQGFDPQETMQKYKFQPLYLEGGNKLSYALQNIRLFHPDIVITNEFGLSTIAAVLFKKFAGSKYRIISIVDDSYDMIANHNDFSLTHRLARQLMSPLLDNLILVEPNVVDWYQKHYHKGFWFPIICDGEKARGMYQRAIPQSQEVVEEYHLQGRHVFLFVGRLVALKNVKNVIRAFRRMEDPNSTLVIIGSGDEEINLKHEADKCNNIIFTGRLTGSSLYKWYNIATAFILASYQEAFGAVTNEALLAGCWAIISNKAGSQCLVNPGVNGDTFNPLDEDELLSKMKFVCDNLPPLPDTSEAVKLRHDAMTCSFREMIQPLEDMIVGKQ